MQNKENIALRELDLPMRSTRELRDEIEAWRERLKRDLEGANN